MPEKDAIVAITLRLPSSLYNRVKHEAEMNCRSVTAYIRNKLSDTPDLELLESRVQALEKQVEELTQIIKKG